MTGGDAPLGRMFGQSPNILVRQYDSFAEKAAVHLLARADANFIALAHNQMPDLLDALEAAWAEIVLLRQHLYEAHDDSAAYRLGYEEGQRVMREMVSTSGACIQVADYDVGGPCVGWQLLTINDLSISPLTEKAHKVSFLREYPDSIPGFCSRCGERIVSEDPVACNDRLCSYCSDTWDKEMERD